MSPRARAYFACACAYAAALLVADGVVRFAPFHPLATAALADAAATIVVFGFSVGLSNSSLYDPYWSVAPPALFVFWIATDALTPRALLVLVLVVVWGARLTWNFLRGWRDLAHEDWRYRDLRAKNGRGYWAVSFLGIHFFPTVLTFGGSLSLWVVATSDRPLGPIDAIAAAITLGAILIEAIADEQLRRHRATNDAILDEGLWRHSRHPNYFGEVTFWWGLYAFALAADAHRFWVVVGPLAITLLFVFISIPMIEKRMIARRPSYAAHRARVSALVPWFRR